jgi:hypothetical protein
MNKRYIHIAVLGALLASGQVGAVEFDGFMTVGVATHDQKTPGIAYLDNIQNNASFYNDSKYGLQVAAEVSEDMNVVAQLLARGTNDNFNLTAAWAYFDYAVTQNTKLRGGKMKEPVFLISDYYEVAYAYPWIRPPQEVYTNNPVNTINGLMLQYGASFGGMNFLLQPFVGTNSEPVPGTNKQAQFLAENYVGATLQLSNSAFTFQVCSFKTDVTTSGFVPVVDYLDGGGNPGSDGVPDVPFNGTPGPMVVMDVGNTGTAALSSVGLSWDIANFVGYTEFVKRDIEQNVEKMFPDQQAYYVTLGYRFGKFMPHVTVAHSESTPVTFNPADPLTAFSNMVAVDQDSVTVGFRYELNDSAAFKFEYEKITLDDASMARGGNGLYNDATTPFGIMPEKDSSVISMSIDVIF